MSGVNNSPSGAPQFTPSTKDATGSRPAGVTPDGKSVSVAPTALAPVDRKALRALQGGDIQDTKSALRKEQAQKLEADKDYKAYRQAIRQGYKQCKEASDVSLGEIQQADATGLRLVEKLIALAQDLHNKYINPAGESPLPIPPAVKGPLERDWAALTDLKRSAQRAGAMTADQRATLDQLRTHLAGAIQALQTFAKAEMDEEAILARYMGVKNQLDRQDLIHILGDPRQDKRLSSLRMQCKQSHCTENLDFLLSFNSLRAGPAAARPAGYRNLFDQFVARSADIPVNIEDELYQRVAAAFGQAPASPTGAVPDQDAVVEETMNEVYEEVFTLLLRNDHARLLKAERDTKGS